MYGAAMHCSQISSSYLAAKSKLHEIITGQSKLINCYFLHKNHAW